MTAYFPDTSGGLAVHGRACSLHYYGAVGSSGHAQSLADRYQVVVGYFTHYSDASGDTAPYSATMISRNSNMLLMPYVKGMEATNRTARGLAAGYPEEYYAHYKAARTVANRMHVFKKDGSIYLAQPGDFKLFNGDPRTNLAGPLGGWSMVNPFIESWEDWRAADAWHDVIQVNIVNGVTAFKGAYCDSMGAGPTVFGLTAVHPGTGTTYNGADWSNLAFSSVGTQMVTNAPGGMTSMANGLGNGAGYFKGTSNLLNYFDGGLAESWLRNNNSIATAFRTESDWQKDVDMVIDANSRGRGVWCVVNLINLTAGNGPAPTFSDTQIERWHKYAICTYMLAKGSKAYMEFVINAGTSNEVKPWTIDHDYYTTDLGASIDNFSSASAYKVTGGCYLRRYQFGAVVVNPTGGTCTWVLDRTYTLVDGSTAYGTSGATKILPANTALMLFTGTSISPPSNPHAPVVVLNSPEATVDSPSQTISVDVTDAEDSIASVTISVNGASPSSMTNTTGSTWTKAVTFNAVDNQITTNTVSIVATDSNGSPRSTTVMLIFSVVTGTPPVPPSTPSTIPYPDEYDVLIGRLSLIALQDDIVESLGNTLLTVGGGVVPGDRQPHSFALALPIRSASADDDGTGYFGEKLRRQARSLLSNDLLKNQGLYFHWLVDEEQDGWLMIGQASITDSRDAGGITFSEWTLALEECYKIGNIRTCRDAVRITYLRRASPTTPKDYRREWYGSVYPSFGLPIAEWAVPTGASDVTGFLHEPLVPTSVRSLIDGSSVAVYTNRVDGEILSWEIDEGSLWRNVSDVVCYDRQGNTAVSYSSDGDISPEGGYGWEEVYGADYPYSDGDVPVIQNGICRVTYDPDSQTFVYWAVNGSQYDEQGRFYCYTNNGGIVLLSTLLNASVVEWTPERGVVKATFLGDDGDGTFSRAEVYIVLQRGWLGPEIHSYGYPGGLVPHQRFVVADAGSATVTDGAGAFSSPTTYTDGDTPGVSIEPADTGNYQVNWCFTIDSVQVTKTTDTQAYGASHNCIDFDIDAVYSWGPGIIVSKLFFDARGTTSRLHDDAASTLADSRTTRTLTER